MSTVSNNYTSTVPSLDDDDRNSIPDTASVRTSAASLLDAIPFSQVSGSSNGHARFADPTANRAQSTESNADVPEDTSSTSSDDSAERAARINQWMMEASAPWTALALNDLQHHTSTKTPSLAEQIVDNLPADSNTEDQGFDMRTIPEDQQLAFCGSWTSDQGVAFMEL